VDTASPRELIAEVEGHLRALLRDVLCGYLDADLKAVADDMLLDAHGEPLGEIEARDLRMEPEPEPDPVPETAPAREPRFERRPDPDPVTFEPELEYESDYDDDTAPDYEAETPDHEADVQEYEADAQEFEDEYDTAEMEPVPVAREPVQHAEPAQHAEPLQHPLDGVTQSADWGWDDPEDFSAPV
jgi:hypothetical protein